MKTEILSLARELTEGAQQHITRLSQDSAGYEREYEQSVCEQPLLDELSDYVAGAARTGSARAGSGYGSRMLISSDALEVQQHIEHTVIGYGVRGDLKGQVLTWAQSCADGDEYQQALTLQTLAHWCEQIRSMRYATHELTAPCPICRCERIREKSTVNGGYMLRRALCYTVKRAKCRACGAVWEGEVGMRELAKTFSQDFRSENP